MACACCYVVPRKGLATRLLLLHEVNLGWHPQAEDLLRQPGLQETKFFQTGGKKVRYKQGLKGTLIDGLRELLAQELPYCNIRYAF
jgi:spore photoproduct lyase